MNENIDLTKILKDCPKGVELYSPICGIVLILKVYTDDIVYPIRGIDYKGTCINFTKEGHYYANCQDTECLLFPSRYQRDWSKFTAPWLKKDRFDPKTLKPFDKVIVKCNDFKWVCDMFSHYDISKSIMPYVCVGGFYDVCIPYNEDTKHLLGTREEAPEYYRYWED